MGLMIGSGLVGALIGKGDDAAWGFWLFGMLCYLPIVYILLVSLPNSTAGDAAQALYKKVSILTVVLWSVYPLVWVLAEGTGSVDADQEVYLYTVLDILAKSGFGLLICMARDACDQASKGN